MQWIKASERLPEFVNRDKKYIVRYTRIPDELEVWNWDWINEREAAQYDFEWLDENPPPAASAVEEAARMYPYLQPSEYLSMDADNVNRIADHRRQAHITCAGMYTDTIDKLKAEVESLRKLLPKEYQNILDKHDKNVAP